MWAQNGERAVLAAGGVNALAQALSNGKVKAKTWPAL